MDDYINREDALDIVADNNVTGEITLNRYDKIIDGIYDIPSADVAPVVRCEECKHLVVLNARNMYAHCKRNDIRFEPFGYDTRTNYCSWAERKDNETD